MLICLCVLYFFYQDVFLLRRWVDGVSNAVPTTFTIRVFLLVSLAFTSPQHIFLYHNCTHTSFIQPPVTHASTKNTETAAASPVAASPVTAATAASATVSGADLGQQLFNAANNNDTAKMTTLLNTPGVNINFINAVSLNRHPIAPKFAILLYLL